jgi:hypothetical protein
MIVQQPGNAKSADWEKRSKQKQDNPLFSYTSSKGSSFKGQYANNPVPNTGRTSKGGTVKKVQGLATKKL